MLEMIRVYFVVFGAFTIVGGVIGYVKAKSRASLIAGSLAGASLVGAAYVIGSRPAYGLLLAIAVSLALAGRFIRSYMATRKVMPAGLISVLSVIGLVVGAVGLLRP